MTTATMTAIAITTPPPPMSTTTGLQDRDPIVDGTMTAMAITTPGLQDEMFLRLRREAAVVVKNEPILSMLLSKVGLLDATAETTAGGLNKVVPATSFEEAIARIVSHRLSSCSGKTESICPTFLSHLIEESFRSTELEMGHTMTESVREDAIAIVRRDPACETLLEAVLFMKGFHSLVIHRAARRAWKPAPRHDNGVMINGMIGNSTAAEIDKTVYVEGKRFVALLLQSQASSAFGVDIHPASSIGAGVMIDHGSGVVIGETATVGDGSTILHNVTLGGTGKAGGDRHPKIGRHVLIGAGTQILGNIIVGDCAKIGAGSVVLRPIPSGATAVGAPAKIIGMVPKGELPGSNLDMKLGEVEPLLGDKFKKCRTSPRVLKRELTEESTATTTDDETMEKIDHLPPPKHIIHRNISEISGESNLINEGETKESMIREDETEEFRLWQKRNGVVGEEDSEESRIKEDSEESTSKEDEKGEEEEDDNVTDFGTTPKCRWIRASCVNEDLCPFSGSFRAIPSSVKKNCISHKELRELLVQEGCTEGECVEVYFELLHCTPASSDFRQYGCIPLEIFKKCFPDIAKEKTRMDAERTQAMAEGDLRALGMSKKASKRFTSMLNRLATSTLQRVSSFGSMSSVNK